MIFLFKIYLFKKLRKAQTETKNSNEIHKIKTEILHDESAATGGAKFSRKVPTEKVTEKLELLKKELVEMKGKVRIIVRKNLF